MTTTTELQNILDWLTEALQVVNRYQTHQKERISSPKYRPSVNWDISDGAIARYFKWCQLHSYDPLNKIYFWLYWGIPIPTSGLSYQTGPEITQKSSLEIFGPANITPEQLETNGINFFKSEYNFPAPVDELGNQIDVYYKTFELEDGETFEVKVKQTIWFEPTRHPKDGEYQEFGGDFRRNFEFSTHINVLAAPFGHTFAGEIKITPGFHEGLRETIQSLYVLTRRTSMSVVNHQYLEKRVSEMFLELPSKYQGRNRRVYDSATTA